MTSTMARCDVSAERDRSAQTGPAAELGPGRKPASATDSAAQGARVTMDESTRLSTVNGGKPGPAVDRPATLSDETVNIGPSDAVLDALSQAQHITKNSRPARSRRVRKPTRTSGYSGAGPDDRDPQLAGGVLHGLLAERDWQRPLAQARVFADWAGLVGADIASHCQPTELREGQLRIAAQSSAWATQLRLMAGALLASLVAELGPDVVTSLFITGPVGPSWKHGAWSVRGSRGPRDTYG